MIQARSKHKMTGGGGGLSEWPTLTSPSSLPPLKHTSWYMSDHYICLQYLLFLSLIFRLCWLWRNRELVWDIIHGKFAKQLLSVFFLPNVVISYICKGQSITLFCPCEHATSWGRSGGIVIGAFRSIQLFLAEQKYDFVHLHNSKLHRRTTVHNLNMIDNTLKL